MSVARNIPDLSPSSPLAAPQAADCTAVMARDRTAVMARDMGETALSALALGPDDQADLVRCESWPLPQIEDARAHTYVVIHRRHGVHTHVYTVIDSPALGRRQVHLRGIWNGEAGAAARAWVLAGGYLGRMGL